MKTTKMMLLMTQKNYTVKLANVDEFNRNTLVTSVTITLLSVSSSKENYIRIFALNSPGNA